MSKLETMKVLDVQWGTPKMPDDVKKFFFNYYDNIGNDVWVFYEVGNSSNCDYDEDEDGNEIVIKGELSILDKWLISECDLVLGEELLMNHWW